MRRQGTTTILYVAGWGRSGSTLFGRIAGELPGLHFAGEVNYVWSRGIRDNHMCSCGNRFLECSFWTQVGETGFGGWSQIDIEGLFPARGQILRHRRMPLELSTTTKVARRQLELIERLYSAISEVSGSGVVVDSAKMAPYALLLRKSRRLDLRIVRLVRDSRAVAFSWGRAKPSPDEASGTMPRVSTSKSSLMWLTEYTMFEALRLRGVRSSLVRYEDFIGAPENELARALRELEISRNGLETIIGGIPALRGHAFSGNPMRLDPVAFPLTEDDEWRRAMPWGDRAIANAITWPLLKQYGYLARP